MNLIKEGLKKKLIRFEEDEKYIVYIHQEKRRLYTNPEEKIQAQCFCSLVITYGYPVTRIQQFVPISMGVATKEADIVVYSDDEHKSPLIVVECKKETVSELEFTRATDQAVSYAISDGAKYVWVSSGLKNEYFEIPKVKPKDRILLPDVPPYGVTSLAKYKYAKNGGKLPTGQKLFPIETVEHSDLTRRFQQAHQALWGGGELNPSEAFDELDKLIFCKIWDERKPRKNGEPYDFQTFTEDTEEKTAEKLLERLKKLYAEGRKKDPEVFKDDIRLSASKARTVVTYLEAIDLSNTDLDSKGRAFEAFMGSFFRGDFGQYFTPRPIVDFITEVLPITHTSYVLDTSCGSGGFLLHALDKVRQEASEYYDEDSKEHFRHWHDFAEHNLYGIEINDQIARTAKMNMIIHDDGHTNVIASDGLLPPSETQKKNEGFKENHFDFIITNPPFGSTVKQTEKAYMSQYNLATKDVDWLNPKSKAADRPGQSTEVLFIEQCANYLREGGYLAIVIPDGILTNSSLQYVRDEIEELYRIVAIISMPQTAFASTGAGVKSSVLFLRKYSQKTRQEIKDQKQSIQDDIKREEKLIQKIDAFDKEKKAALKVLRASPEFADYDYTVLKTNRDYQEQKKALNDASSAKLADLRYRLSELYAARRSKELTDYEIFMAIAEDIGYDATGRETNNNELEIIAPELKDFITTIEMGAV